MMEGNHLLPALLQHLQPTRFVLMAAPLEVIARRLTGATHRRRTISVGIPSASSRPRRTSTPRPAPTGHR
jgi:hypothetical protein